MYTISNLNFFALVQADNIESTLAVWTESEALGYYGNMVEKHEIPDAAWLLALLLTPGIGAVTVNRLSLALIEANLPFHALIGHTPSVLRKGLPAGLEWTVEPLANCESASVDRALFMHDRILNTGGQWLIRGEADYPEALISVMDYSAPPLLSVYGDVGLLRQGSMSIIGSRDPSDRGCLLAEELATWAQSRDRCVVSGGANGIDSAAHKAALDSGGESIFMIPQGALTYEGPPWVKSHIESGNAAVVSSLIPDTDWSASGAMGRNRLVAAMGQLICVIDPALESGSQKAAHFALEYDKRSLVYAYDKVNSAYGDLIRKGAFPILDENGMWDESYLENHWSIGGRPLRKQWDLF